MKFGVISLFPEIFSDSLPGLVGQAQKKGLFDLSVSNPRAYASGVHQVVDDPPFGGGDGMLLKAEPLMKCLKDMKAQKPGLAQAQVVYLSPQGQVWNQARAQEWAINKNPKILVCGRYAGLDERFIQNHCDEEISIGNYILNGGELAALVVIESVARLLQGTLGNATSAAEDSFSGANLSDIEKGLLEPPQYTRPRVWQEHEVPETLVSGDHKKIARWKKKLALLQTAWKRWELLSLEQKQSLKQLLNSSHPVDKDCLKDFGLEKLNDLKKLLKA